MKIVRQCLRILFVFVLLLSFFSCDFHLYDPDKPKPGYLDEMPDETNVGANTFGCYVNGELAATQGYYQEEGVEYSDFKKYVIGFWKKKGNDRTMFLKASTKIAFFDFSLDGSLHIGENKCNSFSLYLYKTNEYRIMTDLTIDIFKIDTIEHIISGQFDDIILHMSSAYIDTCTIVSVTKGQFDIKYGQNY